MVLAVEVIMFSPNLFKRTITDFHTRDPIPMSKTTRVYITNCPFPNLFCFSSEEEKKKKEKRRGEIKKKNQKKKKKSKNKTKTKTKTKNKKQKTKKQKTKTKTKTKKKNVKKTSSWKRWTLGKESRIKSAYEFHNPSTK